MIQRSFAATPNNAREPDRLEVIGLVRESIRGGLRATLSHNFRLEINVGVRSHYFLLDYEERSRF
jgi:hypothetical protein